MGKCLRLCSDRVVDQLAASSSDEDRASQARGLAIVLRWLRKLYDVALTRKKVETVTAPREHFEAVERVLQPLNDNYKRYEVGEADICDMSIISSNSIKEPNEGL